MSYSSENYDSHLSKSDHWVRGRCQAARRVVGFYSYDSEFGPLTYITGASITSSAIDTTTTLRGSP